MKLAAVFEKGSLEKKRSCVQIRNCTQEYFVYNYVSVQFCEYSLIFKIRPKICR